MQGPASRASAVNTSSRVMEYELFTELDCREFEVPRDTESLRDPV
jgi:hypothetical protein